MDSKQWIFEHLRTHPGVQYTADELAGKVNQDLEWDVQINPQEVRKYGLELSEEHERLHHWIRETAQTIEVNGEYRALILDDEILRNDIVAELAPDRLSEAENYHGQDLVDWILEEIADDTKGSAVEHIFKFQERGWGGP